MEGNEGERTGEKEEKGEEGRGCGLLIKGGKGTKGIELEIKRKGKERWSVVNKKGEGDERQRTGEKEEDREGEVNKGRENCLR